MRGLLPAVAALLLVPLSGCAGSASGDADEDPVTAGVDVEVTVTKTTGAILGVVVDPAIVPIAGAAVRVAGLGLEATTTEAGAFGFSEIDPGAYFIEVSKPGFAPVQQSVEVVAGVADPRPVKVLLQPDPTYDPYVEGVVYEGFIECTTTLVVLCGAPNAEEPLLCEAFDLCYGNVTNDRFTWYEYHRPGAALIQSEMAWESTQTLSPNLSFSQEALNLDCPNTDLFTVLNGTDGASPIYTQLWPPVLEQYEIGETCGVYYSVFAGEAQEGTFAGFTLQQEFTMYTHSFYGFTPPKGWRFAVDGEPAVPQ